MNNATEQWSLRKWEKIVNLMDYVVIIATIVYYAILVNRLGLELFTAEFNYLRTLKILAENTGLLGIAILLFSLVTFISIIYLTIRKRMNGGLGAVKTIATVIWNGAWIVGDGYMLYLVLSVRM